MEEIVRSRVDAVLAILRNPDLTLGAARVECRKQLRRLLCPCFDFVEMAKQSLGIHWRRRTPEEQQKFVEMFTDLLGQCYLQKLESYNGEKILYALNIQEQGYGEVDTKILATTGEEVSVVYKLHLVNGEWKIYDIVIDSMSVISNYRSQFHRTIATASYDELIRILQGKQTEAGENVNSEVGAT
jgi:phospholipid transport system substrate-binding protein